MEGRCGGCGEGLLSLKWRAQEGAEASCPLSTGAAGVLAIGTQVSVAHRFFSSDKVLQTF